MKSIRISVAQSNFVVGDIAGNVSKIREGIDKALQLGSQIVVFPELAISGYPPEDLLLKPQFLDENAKALKAIVDYTRTHDIMAVIGCITKDDNIYNSAAIVYNGSLADIYQKIYLPNYGVFDEKRYFTSGSTIPIYIYDGVKIGVNICEDIWYPTGPLHYQSVMGGAELILNISASPYHAGKQDYRENMCKTRAGDESVILVNCNLVGGQDELVFDGCSSIYDENGALIGRMKAFAEDFMTFDVNLDSVFRKRLKDIRRRQEQKYQESPFPIRTVQINTRPNTRLQKVEISPTIAFLPDVTASIYEALVLGTRDYINKNGFKSVIIAISGGIDSAIVAAIAVDALGKDRVKGIYLPSQFSASISGEDAHELAKHLGIEMFELPIKPLFDEFSSTLKPIFKDLPFNVAEENLQSRIRGNIVMAISNKFGWLVLTTGNKSEMSTGYATLYGDMAGGFAVIKDVLKTTVYDIVRYRNHISLVIPERIITRPPTAELRPDQKDTDSLPEYEVLDTIIRAYVEDDLSLAEIVEKIGDEALVQRVIRMIDLSEYKRRQAPPGVKISTRAFGRDRRMPITNRYRV